MTVCISWYTGYRLLILLVLFSLQKVVHSYFNLMLVRFLFCPSCLHIYLTLQHASEADIQAALAMQGEGLQAGEIQILHATPEQISQLQHAQHIQILSGDQVIGVSYTNSNLLLNQNLLLALIVTC